MTVIAYFPDLSIAASDLLLSMDRPGGAPVQLPSIGSTYNLKDLSLSPTNLVRKIHRLKHGRGEVVMLIAGTVSHLKKLVDSFELIRAGRYKLPPRLAATLNESDPLSVLHTASVVTDLGGYSEFEFIAFHKARRLDARYDVNRRFDVAPYFGETLFAGSGASDLSRWLCQRGEQYLDHPALVGETTEVKRFRVLNLIPSLLLEEDTRESLKTINNGVGGYYESFEVDKNGLYPQDAVLTVFASLETNGKDVHVELRRMFFHLYADDWLFIISLSGQPRRLIAGQTVRVDMSEFDFYKVKPLLYEGEPPNWDIPRLAVQMPSAQHWRLTLYRETNTDTPQLKRFSHVRGAKQPIISISVKNQTMNLTLEQKRLEYYMNRFPKRPADKHLVTVHV